MARPPPVPSAPLPALVALLHTGVAEIGHEVNEPTDGGDPRNEGGAGGIGVASEGGEPSNNCDAEAKGVAALMSCSLELLAEEGVGKGGDRS